MKMNNLSAKAKMLLNSVGNRLTKILPKKKAGKYFEPTEKAKIAVKILPDEIIYPDTTAV